jgi:thiamine biosynthesis protein ThiS
MIRVNSKWDIAWEQGITVQDVLKACGFTHQQLVVSIDGKLVPPAEYASQPVREGAEVRVVHVIGGG